MFSPTSPVIRHGTPARPTRLEDLPNETLLSVGEACQRQNRATPWLDGVQALAPLNRRLDTLFAAPLRAHRLMREIAAAPDRPALTAALARLDRAPRQYRGTCWETAWETLLRLAAARQGALDIPDDLLELLARVPPHATLQPPPWARVATLLLSGRIGPPPMAVVRQVLQSAAHSPDLTPAAWRSLLRQAKLAFLCSDNPAADLAALAGLTPAQRQDIGVMLDCVFHGRRAGADTLRSLVQRIETRVSPACRLPLLRTLRHGIAPPRPFARSEAAQVMCEALLRVPEPDRAEALCALPMTWPPEDRQALLLQATRTLPDPAALRVLLHHSGTFEASGWPGFTGGTPPADNRQLLLARVDAIVDRSRRGSRHRDVVRELARAASCVAYPELRDLIVAKVLDECPHLAVHDRIATLRHLESVPPHHVRWRVQWHAALQELQARIEDLTPARAGPLVRLLLHRYWTPDEREDWLALLRPMLRRLRPEDLATALEDLISRWECSYGPCSKVHFERLLEDCARLPHYLRERSLAALDRLATWTPQAGSGRLKALQDATSAARRAWDAEVAAVRPADEVDEAGEAGEDEPAGPAGRAGPC